MLMSPIPRRARPARRSAQPQVRGRDLRFHDPVHGPRVHPPPACRRRFHHPPPVLAAPDQAQARLPEQGAELVRGRRHGGRVADRLGDAAGRPRAAARELLHLVLRVRRLGAVALVQRPGQGGGLVNPPLAPERLQHGGVEPPADVTVPPRQLQEAGDLLVPGSVPPRPQHLPPHGVVLGDEEVEVVLGGARAAPPLPVTDEHDPLGVEAELSGDRRHRLGLLRGRNVGLRGQLEVADGIRPPRCPSVGNEVVQVGTAAAQDRDLLVGGAVEDVVRRPPSARAGGKA